MNKEHSIFLSCFFGGAATGSIIYGTTGAIIGAVIGIIVAVLSIRNDRNNLAG
jgi:hypothetical protein